MSVLFDKLRDADNQMSTYVQTIATLERKNNILGSAFLELTPLCNFSCKMCYARLSSSEIEKANKHILGFKEWKWFIDCFYEMGTRTLNLTGGECLLHPEFNQIYNYAYDKGFEIVIFTNCSRITEKQYRLFCEKPPASFSITVYGGSPFTYQNLCGNGKAYYDVFANIEKIIEKGFSLLVKYTITNENIGDLPQVYDYFKKKGITLRYQNSLLQLNKADKHTITKLSVDEENLGEVEKSIHQNDDLVKDQDLDAYSINILKNRIQMPKKGIRCSAGRSICHIRWDGLMTPCVSLETIIIDPMEVGLKESWKIINEWAMSFQVIEECDKCVHVLKCPQCTALHYNDTGVAGIPSPRLCWKHNHLKEAKIIETRLIDKGLITAEELYGKEH